MTRRRIRSTLLAATSVGLLMAVAGCAPTGDAEPANMVGTWTGEVTYALPNGTTTTITEQLVIEKQDGPNLWGFQQSGAGGGQRDELVGQLGLGGTTFVLTETDGFYSGVVEGDRMAVRYIELGDANTSYEVELTRESSNDQ
jgi:hypothetical protein